MIAGIRATLAESARIVPLAETLARRAKCKLRLRLGVRRYSAAFSVLRCQTVEPPAQRLRSCAA